MVYHCSLGNTIPTTHQKIKVAKVREYKYANIEPELGHLASVARQIQVLETVRLMKEIISEFKSKNSCFEELDKQKKMLYPRQTCKPPANLQEK